MARNTKDDAHYTVGIARTSELLKKLQADAEESNVSIAKLIVVRLSDYYQIISGQNRRPGVPATMAGSQQVEPGAEPPAKHETETGTSTHDAVLDAAMDAWNI